MNRLEKLLMRVELIDRVTAPANKLMASVDKLTSRAGEAFGQMAISSAAIFGIGLAMTSLTADARDMQMALGEVRSLSVQESALISLEKTALQFSISYGESATNFVRSAYDIQSAISGLTGNELSRFTEASNILAKGTKSDANTITNYMGTMYGIFKQNADAMGKSQWVAQLAGQTAQAVEMFKTTGVQMSGAFTALGADAQAHGIAINEQMAVLGKLQATMSGSEAGTKYKAFLRGVGVAQEKLGLQFTDSAGRMLPVNIILEKLQKKFGAIDTVAKSDALKKAFGSDEAVAMIKLMMTDTQGLASSIDQLGRVTGMDKAREMAAAMVDPLDRLVAANTAVRISFGKVVNQAMYPFYDAAIEGLSTINRWIEMFPNLTKFIAKAVLAFFAFSGALALLAIAKGAVVIATMGLTTGFAILRVMMIPFAPLLAALRMAWLVFNMQLIAGAGIIPALRAGLIALNTQLLLNLRSLSLVRFATWLYASTMGLLRAAVLATAIRFPALITALIAARAGFMTAVVGAKAFAMALLTNPITWIVLSVVGLITGLVMLVRHWDAVKLVVVNFANTVVEKWQWLRGIIENNVFLSFVFAPLLMAVDVVSWVIDNLQLIPAWFATFSDWLTALGVFTPFTNALDWVSQKWAAFRALLEDNAFLQFLFAPLVMAVDGVALLLSSLEKIPAWFTQFKNWLGNLNPFEMIGKAVDWLIDKLNMIPGVNIGKSDMQPPALTSSSPNAAPPMVEQLTAIPGLNQPNSVTPVQPVQVTNLVQPAPITNVVKPVIEPVPTTSVVQPVIEPAPVVNVVPLPKQVEQGATVDKTMQLENTINKQRDDFAPPSASLAQHVPPGGLRDQITNSNTSKNIHIDRIDVKTMQKFNGYSFADELKMAGG